MLFQTSIETAVSVSWLSSQIIDLSRAFAMVVDFARFIVTQMTAQDCVNPQSDVAQNDLEPVFDLSLLIGKYFL